MTHEQAVSELNKLVIEKIRGMSYEEYCNKLKRECDYTCDHLGGCSCWSYDEIEVELPQILAALKDRLNNCAVTSGGIMHIRVATINPVIEWKLLADQKTSATTEDQTLETLLTLIKLLK